jgi:hypothetical protein
MISTRAGAFPSAAVAVAEQNRRRRRHAVSGFIASL